MTTQLLSSPSLTPASAPAAVRPDDATLLADWQYVLLAKSGKGAALALSILGKLEVQPGVPLFRKGLPTRNVLSALAKVEKAAWEACITNAYNAKLASIAESVAKGELTDAEGKGESADTKTRFEQALGFAQTFDLSAFLQHMARIRQWANTLSSVMMSKLGGGAVDIKTADGFIAKFLGKGYTDRDHAKAIKRGGSTLLSQN